MTEAHLPEVVHSLVTRAFWMLVLKTMADTIDVKLYIYICTVGYAFLWG